MSLNSVASINCGQNRFLTLFLPSDRSCNTHTFSQVSKSSAFDPNHHVTFVLCSTSNTPCDSFFSYSSLPAPQTANFFCDSLDWSLGQMLSNTKLFWKATTRFKTQISAIQLAFRNSHVRNCDLPEAEAPSHASKGRLFSLIVDGVDTDVFQFFLDQMKEFLTEKAASFPLPSCAGCAYSSGTRLL